MNHAGLKYWAMCGAVCAASVGALFVLAVVIVMGAGQAEAQTELDAVGGDLQVQKTN